MHHSMKATKEESLPSSVKKPENHRSHHSKDVIPGSELWTDGLICAFEFVRTLPKPSRPKSYSKLPSVPQVEVDNVKKQMHAQGGAELSAQRSTQGAPEHFAQGRGMKNSVELGAPVEIGTHGHGVSVDKVDRHHHHPESDHFMERTEGSHWIPIGWARISELVQSIQVDTQWSMQPTDLMDDEDDITVADLAAPYWERQAGPTWWCHVSAGHPYVEAWLNSAQWLHPAISVALRDESRLISERMKHLLYEVPVRVAGGLLFELLGQSAGDPYVDEDDIPVVLRSWQSQNFLITALHVKGSASRINVLGITEVLELLLAGGYCTPTTAHGVIAHLATRLARWDDRLFRKNIFGVADELELKFMNRRNHEDLNLFGIILNQEIRRLSMQVIRVKWSLHAREEIVFELLQHLKGISTKRLLEGVRNSTREMIEEQEAVRGRLFTIQDVMQSTIRAWLQDRSLRVTHNLTVCGGGGLVLTIITGLFGINVDGIPGATNTPYAFGLFSGLLVVLGILLIAIGFLYFGLKNPVPEEQVEVRKLELQEFVKMFQHEAETHAQVRKPLSRNNLPPTAADKFVQEADYVLID
ncbi:OLC1v1022112C2 [Oldenlandia corymbosa var. corymbosa]|nr:OLC1v1022112C2 [Oldenlandia corymbosa var. corymbosa]